MVNFRIVAVGSNRLLSLELVEAIKLILGEDICVEPCLATSVDEDTPGDLFVCNPTPLNHLMKVKPIDRILVLNLSPTSQFFVRVALIPRGQCVHIFNNKMEYTARLAACCRQFGLDEIDYIPIAYEEMPEDEVIRLIQEARYIIGVDTLVGPEVLLSGRFKQYVHPETLIIGAKRVASVQSACALVQWVATQIHEEIARGVSQITLQLFKSKGTSEAENGCHNPGAIAEEINRLIEKNAKSAETIRRAIMHSVTSQIIPNSLGSDTPASGAAGIGQRKGPVETLYKTIDDMNSLSKELLSIRDTLPL